ncbi:MAG: type III-B CRISPR module RAMP protein Cmr1, partial [Calditrichaeota bacterium]
SVKGALRWWWRALNGHLNLDELKRKEAAIFGSTEQKSSFNLTVEPISMKSQLKDLPKGAMAPVKGKSYKASIIHYLSFGLSNKGHFFRPHIISGSKFKIVFTFFQDTKDDVFNALYNLIQYGGLGAKTRNGMGAVFSQRPLLARKKTEAKARTEYTSFSGETRLYKFGFHDSWVAALSEIGMVYRDARLDLENQHEYEKRVLVAMPIVQDENTKNDDRHAKPFFLHVNKIENKYQGHILFMPHDYYNNVFRGKKKDAYNSVMKEMCQHIEKSAREVTDAL